MPVVDHLQTPQLVHMSVADVAVVGVEYLPAGHSCIIQLDFGSVPDHLIKLYIFPNIGQLIFNY